MTARLVVTSFGYLHGDPPPADVTVDLRDWLRDPHVDPAMRELTGLDPAVRDKVELTPGAAELARKVVWLAATLAGLADEGRQVRVALGCAGGRHRSVAVAELVADRLRNVGWWTDVVHRDVGLPVVVR